MKREESLFDEAIECGTPTAAGVYLDQACAGDAGLRQRVERLLAAHWGSDSLIDAPLHVAVATIDIAPAISERRGDQIGPYKLIQQIGEGGMGVVHMAQQTEPVKRLVALKIIKPGMDSRQVIARFEAERQALALMDHPNIAKIFDAGMTGERQGTRDSRLGTQGSDSEGLHSTPNPEPRTPPSGRPYFVMELVRGIPITKYCDEKGLTPKERLELFIPVCHAVQHAHQKGIIHRDLKPTNVLIAQYDSRPVPKVIDFGVAKATGGQLTEKTLVTNFGSLVGTLEYMSPEQAELNQLDVDTRSDIYSLGVLLYELLTGGTPFDRQRLKSAAFDEMLRIIREEEPETVSARLAKTKSSRHAPRDEAQRKPVRGTHAVGRRDVPTGLLSRSERATVSELDWIVMKALEKDRSRRYESASAFAADVQRYLDGEPVLACPPTALYRFQKFAKKHKPALATAALFAACLLLGTTISLWQALRATAAEGQANTNEAQAQASAQEAKEKAQEATAQRDEAQKQRDEVKALADRLAAKEQQLQRTLYAAHINLSKSALDAGAFTRVKELLDQHRPQPGERDLRDFEWRYLFRLCNGGVRTLGGHETNLHSVAFSADGKRLASASSGVTDWTGQVKLWDAETGKELLSLKGADNTLDLSPDGKRLAGNGGFGEVKIWDAETGQEIRTIRRDRSSVGQVAFSPDGGRLATLWDRNPDRLNPVSSEISLWDVQTGDKLLTIKPDDEEGPPRAPQMEFSAMAFSKDGKRIASGSGNRSSLVAKDPGVVTIWDEETGKKLLSLQGHTKDIRELAFSPDGKRLASCSSDKSVILWDIETGGQLFTIKDDPDGPWCISISPDGGSLAVGGRRNVRLFDANSGQERSTLKGHSDWVERLAFSPDGKHLASASSDKTVKIWDIPSEEKPLALKKDASVTNVVFSPDGKHLAAIGRGSAWREQAPSDGRVWDLFSHEELATLQEFEGGNNGAGNGLAYSPDGKRIAAGGVTTRANIPAALFPVIKLWDASSGQELLSLLGHETKINGVAFSPDGKQVASASEGTGYSGRVWFAPRGAPPPIPVGAVQVWSADSGDRVVTLGGHTGGTRCVAYSPDGERIVTSGHGRGMNKGEVKMWNAQTGQEMFSLKGFGSYVTIVAYSPDGQRLATATEEGQTVQLWDGQTGKELLALKGHGAAVNSLAFSPNGKRLATAAEKSVKLWDAETGEELLTMDAHDASLGSVAFSPDGNLLACGAEDGTIKIYDATPLPEKP
jgi:eukaryotic-like serine/threonine-protein kinase